MADKWSEFEVAPIDKWKEFEVTPPVSQTEASKGETFLRGATQGATFGFGDEAQALIRGLSPVQLEPSSIKIPGTDMPIPKLGWNTEFGKIGQLLQDERKAQEASFAANPKTAIAGQVVGSIPQGLSMARGAIMGGPKLLGQMIGGAGTAAKLGTIGAAGNVDTSDPEWARKAVESAGLTTAVGAAGPVVDRVISPVVKYVAGKAFPSAARGGQDATAEALRGNIPAATPSVGDIIGKSISLPAAGALAGMASREFGPFESDKIPWSPDPLSAAADRGLYGLYGAGVGLGARVGIGAAKDVVTKGIPIIQKSFNQVGNMVTQGETRPMFKTMDELLHGAEYPKGIPPAAKGPTATPGVPPDQARKQAMEQTSTPQGRAKTNPESPVSTDGSSMDELDEYFKRIQPNRVAEQVNEVTVPPVQFPIIKKALSPDVSSGQSGGPRGVMKMEGAPTSPADDIPDDEIFRVMRRVQPNFKKAQDEIGEWAFPYESSDIAELSESQLARIAKTGWTPEDLQKEFQRRVDVNAAVEKILRPEAKTRATSGSDIYSQIDDAYHSRLFKIPGVEARLKKKHDLNDILGETFKSPAEVESSPIIQDILKNKRAILNEHNEKLAAKQAAHRAQEVADAEAVTNGPMRSNKDSKLAGNDLFAELNKNGLRPKVLDAIAQKHGYKKFSEWQDTR